MRIKLLGMALAGPLLLHACHSDAQKLSLKDGEPADFALPAHPQILFFVDGLRADVLEELRADGRLPRLQEHLLDRGARVRSAVVCVPSVTYPNAVTMLTGCWPSTHGVWANVCFDREALLGRNFEVMREHAVGDAARPTMFELLQGELTASIAMPFERGSKVSFARSLGSGGEVAWVGWMLGKKQFTDLRLSEQLYEVESLA